MVCANLCAEPSIYTYELKVKLSSCYETLASYFTSMYGFFSLEQRQYYYTVKVIGSTKMVHVTYLEGSLKHQ